MNQMDADSPPQNNVLTPRWGLVAGLCSLLPLFLFAYFGDPGRGRAAAICLAVIIVAARARWSLKKYAWFWWTLTIVIVLHIPLIVLVPWTSTSYPGITLLPVAVVDYAIVWACIKLAEKIANRV
jgi:hypothetical protein